MSVAYLAHAIDMLVAGEVNVNTHEGIDYIELLDPQGASLSEFDERLQEIEELADMELIKNDGTPNFKAHKELKELGYRVTKGESDSFGWLTGVIHTPKGCIVYG